MTTPFYKLQAYYGPEGAGAKKPCFIYHSSNMEPPCSHVSPHCPTCLCSGPGTILDTEHPLFKALWRLPRDYAFAADNPRAYVRRSRPEAALRLPEVCPRMTLAHVKLPPGAKHPMTGLNEWWIAAVPCPKAEHQHASTIWGMETCLEGTARYWLDALSAAILAQEKAP